MDSEGILQELLRASASGKGIGHVISVASELTGLAMVVSDSDYRIVAYGGDLPRYGSEFEDMVRTKRIGAKRIREFDTSGLNAALRHYKGLYLMEFGGSWWLTTLVFADGVEVGMFAAVFDDADDLPRYYTLVSLIAQLVTIEMQKESFADLNEDATERLLLRELISDLPDENRIDTLARRLNWNLPDQCTVVVAAALSGRIAKRGLDGFLAFARRRIRFVQGMTLEGRLVALVGGAGLERTSSGLWLDVEDYLAQRAMVAGVSAPARRISEYPVAYHQAEKALETALKSDPAPTLSSYRDFYLFDLYDRIARTGDPLDFCITNVKDLERDCHGARSDWIDTLEAYLVHPSNPDAAARALGIHRSTLFYRINRMKDDYGIDLDDGLERLYVLLSIRFLKYRRADAVGLFD